MIGFFLRGAGALILAGSSFFFFVDHLGLAATGAPRNGASKSASARTMAGQRESSTITSMGMACWCVV